MRRSRRIIGALAVAATLLTGAALADAEPAAGEVPAETKLALRPSTPLALDAPPASTGAGWKLAAFTVVAVGGVWLWKQKAKRPVDHAVSQLRVLQRTTIGVRSELLLVEIEGQRMLVGVTPSSMQTLFLFPESPEGELAPSQEQPVDSRIAQLLERRIPPREPPPSLPADEDDIFEGQAAGLRALGGRR